MLQPTDDLFCWVFVLDEFIKIYVVELESELVGENDRAVVVINVFGRCN